MRKKEKKRKKTVFILHGRWRCGFQARSSFPSNRSLLADGVVVSQAGIVLYYGIPRSDHTARRAAPRRPPCSLRRKPAAHARRWSPRRHESCGCPAPGRRERAAEEKTEEGSRAVKPENMGQTEKHSLCYGDREAKTHTHADMHIYRSICMYI